LNAKAELEKLINEALSGNTEVLDKTARVRLLAKSIDCHELEEVRPICILSAVTRLVQAIIAHRLSKTAENHQLLTDNQEGFRPGHSTARQADRLLGIIEEADKQKAPLILLYLDFSNFFNTVAIELIERAMITLGFHDDDVQLVKSCNEQVELQIHTDQFESAKIPLPYGEDSLKERQVAHR